jgi:hypothetical protein
MEMDKLIKYKQQKLREQIKQKIERNEIKEEDILLKCQHAHLPSAVNTFALIAPAVRNPAGRERESEWASE